MFHLVHILWVGSKFPYCKLSSGFSCQSEWDWEIADIASMITRATGLSQQEKKTTPQIYLSYLSMTFCLCPQLLLQQKVIWLLSHECVTTCSAWYGLQSCSFDLPDLPSWLGEGWGSKLQWMAFFPGGLVHRTSQIWPADTLSWQTSWAKLSNAVNQCALLQCQQQDAGPSVMGYRRLKNCHWWVSAGHLTQHELRVPDPLLWAKEPVAEWLWGGPACSITAVSSFPSALFLE